MADAQEILSNFLFTVLDSRGYKTRDVNIKEITTRGANYTSALFAIHVKTLNKESKLFAKVATMSKEMRTAVKADKMFRTEEFVYNKLIPVYNNLQKDLDEEHKFVFPEFYGFNNEFGKETVILENLVEHGYKSYSRFKSMDWDHGRVGVEALARFHALSFALSKRDPEGFQKIATDMAYTFDKDTLSQTAIDQFKEMVEKALSVLKEEEYRERVRKFLFETNLLDKYNKPLSAPVLAHGDYRLSNLLFKEKGYDLSAVVVDYQTLHTGCPVADLFYFIFMGSDEHFRRLYYDKLVNHYYTSLQEALQRLAVDPVEVYPRESFESDLKELLPYVLISAVTALPLVVVESESAPRWDSDEADYSTLIVEPGLLYKQRFGGIVDDLVRWDAI
ncbi:ecdysteroid 22-kinase [Danaus plexippus plexippus]|uniref:Ecdysteroid 22-kinase n=1 Tax=Danaus plexippus plexippus TaxID=278856 RepID=A0A212EL62_DANPL|nr:ecdysteroid 22-kinase [Danaus plexippus plexippus]